MSDNHNRFKTNCQLSSSNTLTYNESTENEVDKTACSEKGRRNDKRQFFPGKLYDILNSPAEAEAVDTSIISWMSNGKAWKVHDSKRLEKEIIPKFFKQTKYSSFVRQVNGWGFTRINKGEARGGYFHDLFIKDKPELLRKIRRVKPFNYASNRKSLELHMENARRMPNNSAIAIEGNYVNSGYKTLEHNQNNLYQHSINSSRQSRPPTSSKVTRERARNASNPNFQPGFSSSEKSPYLHEGPSLNNNLFVDQIIPNVGSNLISGHTQQTRMNNLNEINFSSARRHYINTAGNNPLLLPVKRTSISLPLPRNDFKEHQLHFHYHPQSSGYPSHATMLPHQQNILVTRLGINDSIIAHQQQQRQLQLRQQIMNQDQGAIYLPQNDRI